MRVSDVERQRVVEELRRHCAAGRIDVDEYALRVERAMDAGTLQDLDRLLADLPMLRIAEPAGRALTPRVGDRSGRLLQNRPVATLVVLLSVILVLGVVVITIIGFWAWALVLLAGWLIGLLQGRLRRA